MRVASGIIKPIIVIELLAVMLLAGVGTAFAVEPNGASSTPTPGPTATPVSGGSLVITNYSLIYNDELTQVTGVTVTVKNNGAAAHSGIVQVAVDQEGESVTGQEAVNNLAAGATTQVTVNLGPIDIDYYLQTLRVVVTQTS